VLLVAANGVLEAGDNGAEVREVLRKAVLAVPALVELARRRARGVKEGVVVVVVEVAAV